MNKATLAEVVAEKLGVPKKQAEEYLEALVESITQAMVKGDTVTITGFGAFIPKYRSARMGVNPQNPRERIEVPAVVIPKFKAGKALKDALKTVNPAGASQAVVGAED